MQIEIKRKGDKTTIGLTIGVSGYGLCTFYFNRSEEHEVWAAMMKNEIKDQFNRQIEEIRRTAYERGWEDKTKRRKKLKNFDQNFCRPDLVGW